MNRFKPAQSPSVQMPRLVSPSRDDFEVVRLPLSELTPSERSEIAGIHDQAWPSGPLWHERIPANMLYKCDFLHIVRNASTSRIVGFSISSVMGYVHPFTRDEDTPGSGIHLCISAIEESHRGMGLFGKLLREQVRMAVQGGFSIITTMATHDLAVPTLARRLDELAERGIIQGFDATLNYCDLKDCLRDRPLLGELEIRIRKPPPPPPPMRI